MKTEFHKYEGTGNDFVMIDNRLLQFPKTDHALIRKLCDRRFGIGADGLILLETDPQYDFRMVYFNSDGNESSMCGNGGRCLVAFAKNLGLVDVETTFIATDGPHYATMYDKGVVALQMKDVDALTVTPEYVFLDTGSPHHVELVDDVHATDVRQKGAKVRYSDLYGQKGSNVNFVEQEQDDAFKVRTYERGVEDETLSCGTGVTAVAIAMHAIGKTQAEKVTLHVPGGALEVSFFANDGVYSNVFLKGPATFVFKGEIPIP
ncbi:diaminopimelate epimerase [Flavobacterium magnum]|uniref:Diaminopimelate epimerase n=1 Tax=Flavobacterium magnum TaxID=2162713 RepID=A0A2S0RBI3_9FLAO|nr:diaminopimelate epimerase [Flavobacterium magnum]AWA28598.1 diaminopimelate epimerase [Flavobacterium magnum]